MILQANDHPKIAIYIHWPFCISKCPYCDFNSHTFKKIDYTSWQKTYLNQIDKLSYLFKGKNITSIFFGGGTPSLMLPSIVANIIDSLAKYAIITANTEITLEANPTSIESTKFSQFKQAGINRVSLGIQSFNADDLKFLGRNHSPDEAIKAINIAAKYFDNYSFDLIYARPNQSLNAWRKELEFALSFGSKHISLYQLTIEKGTPFFALHRKGTFILPSQDLAADMYDLTDSMLQAKGLNRYEISNYALQGFESKHNLNYWNYGDYLGIGPGANSRLSFFDGLQFKMQAAEMIYKPEDYLNASIPIRNIEILSTIDTVKEFLMMGLRLTSGINFHSLEKFTTKKFMQIINRSFLNKLKESGLLNIDNDHICLTKNGLNLHSKIITEIFEKIELL